MSESYGTFHSHTVIASNETGLALEADSVGLVLPSKAWQFIY